MLRQPIPVARRVTDAEPCPGRLVEAAAEEELAGEFGIGRRELLGIKRRSDRVRVDELLSLGRLLARSGAALLVGDLDTGLTGEDLDRLDEAQVVLLLDERDEVATFAAAETFPESIAGVDVERRSLLVVEGTEALVAARPAGLSVT